MKELLEKRTDRERSRAQVLDRHVATRMRQRRILLGLDQHQLAEMIGVTSQQTHKYENGINRISAGRLYKIAQALNVDINFFFEDLRGHQNIEVTPQRRLLLEFVRNVAAMPDPRHQAALSNMVRAVAGTTADDNNSPTPGFSETSQTAY